MVILPDSQGAANSAVPSRIWAKFKLVQAFMDVLITCFNEEDTIKNEENPLNIIFPDTQGQLPLQSQVGSDNNSN